MFTGLVEELGTVRAIEELNGTRLIVVEAPGVSEQLVPGDSIAVSGVCLTAVRAEADRFETQVVGETLKRTTLGSIAPTDQVNLELPLTAAGRFGGHIVQGHVDGVAVVEKSETTAAGSTMSLSAEPETMRYIVEKGSVALDGVSLTVAATTRQGFSVALIPHTLSVTTLGRRREGDKVNVEVDIIAKYVERMVGGS